MTTSDQYFCENRCGQIALPGLRTCNSPSCQLAGTPCIVRICPAGRANSWKICHRHMEVYQAAQWPDHWESWPGSLPPLEPIDAEPCVCLHTGCDRQAQWFLAGYGPYCRGHEWVHEFRWDWYSIGRGEVRWKASRREPLYRGGSHADLTVCINGW